MKHFLTLGVPSRPRYWVGLSSMLALTLATLVASAAPQDQAAEELAQEAIFTDYLALNLEGAEAKLKEALELCGDSGCSAAVKARVLRDLGVVYIAGMNRRNEGKESFVQALALDPNVELDRDLTTADVAAAFAEAQEEVGVEEAAPPPVATDTGGAPVTEEGITHEPPGEQAVLTPVPIYVIVEDPTEVGNVRVHYRAFGATAWKAIGLDPYRDGYAGQIPCLDIGTTTGMLSYYIEVQDRSGGALAQAGSEDSPFEVEIKHQLAGDPPHLPGKPPAAQCPDPNECPPDFPGCQSTDSLDSGEFDDDEGDGEIKPHRLTLYGQADALLFSGTTGVCTRDRPEDLSCFYSGGTFRDIGVFGEPQAPGGEVTGGFTLGTIRLLLGYDYAVSDQFSLGARAGFAFGGGPKASTADAEAFLPVHGEIRASWWPIDNSFGDATFAPYVTAGGGVAQVDAKVVTTIVETRSDIQGTRSEVEVWKKTGTAFITLGVGTNLMFSKSFGMLAELRAMQMLPVAGTALSAGTGFVTAF